MSIIESLLSGEEKKRDISLVIMLWVIGLLLSISMSMSATILPNPVSVDISGGNNNMVSKLACRVPIPAGEFSVMLPLSEKTAVDEKGLVIALKLPSTMGNSSLGVSVEMRPSDYTVFRPSQMKLREKAFSARLKNDGFILKGPFAATVIESFKSVVSNGRFGYMVRLKGKNSDKLYVEVYEDSRRMIFEIAVVDSLLTQKHRDLLFSVISSIEDFKNI